MKNGKTKRTKSKSEKKGRWRKGGEYVNVESKSSEGEWRYNALSRPGGHRAECPGAGGGRWPPLSGYHYVEGEVFSIFLLKSLVFLSQTPFLSQGKGEVAQGTLWGEG